MGETLNHVPGALETCLGALVARCGVQIAV